MTLKFLKKYIFVILAVIIAVGGYFYVRAVGSEYTYLHRDYNGNSAVKNVFLDKDSTGKVEILDWKETDKGCLITVRSVKPGRVFVTIQYEDYIGLSPLIVHKNGIITNQRYFGDSQGSVVVIVCIMIYLALLTGYFVKRYLSSLKKSLYDYDNILYLGLIVFSIYMMLSMIGSIINRNGVITALSNMANSTQSFVLFTWPLVVITTVVVTISNVQLIRKEGKTWRNMLAFFLGLFLGLGSLSQIWLEERFFYSKIIDTHYEKGFGQFILLFLENMTTACVTYLECILIGTIIIALMSARHIPSFDKDYIIIHGCQIRKDGTLTKLLQSRTDKAIEFSKLQKEATGKDIVFVPSGGKGSDEVISEGEAIRNYLLENGISEDYILTENKSVNTEENVKFAMKMMREHYGSDDYKAAFATTNYHVFRTGMLAEQSGLKAEGIGSPTKRYFWINAFVREFIATIVKEKKTHAKVALVVTLINIINVIALYISVLLS